MPSVLIIQSKTETIFDDEDFARLLREKLGDDAADYFLGAVETDSLLEKLDLDDDDILKGGWCSGECDKVQGTQEHYENLLKEIDDLAHEIYCRILDKVNKRTNEEQFAIYKVNEIMRVVNQNT